VLDLGAPSSQRAIIELEKPMMRERLHWIALKRTESDAAADDLIEDTLVRVLDPDDLPWNHEQYTFVGHMKFAMRRTWADKLRQASVQREIPAGAVGYDEATGEGDGESPDEDKEARPNADPRADDELDRMRAAARRDALLEEVVASLEPDYPLVRPLCELGGRGIDSPSEQARQLGCPVEAIYEAMATLKRHAQKALADWDRAERRRMMMARATATAPAAGKKEATP
jgi:DNA-directed RNA polymerase specialized sigma24 family protein